jgi:hypothetical protein
MSRHGVVAVIAAVIGLLAGPGSMVAQASGPTLILSPGSMDFGTTAWTNSPILGTFTLQNVAFADGANVGITSITTTVSEFSVWSTTCGSVLPLGKSCTITVAFRVPNITSSYSGDLVVANTIHPVKAIPGHLTGRSVAVTGCPPRAPHGGLCPR